MFKSYDVFKLAAQKMIEENFVIFDTETTGVAADDEIVELGIVDCRGNVLYDGMFCPDKPMNPSASLVSGITDDMLADQPRFQDEFQKIVSILDTSGVIAFNEPFDERLFYQTAQKKGLDTSVLDRIFSRAYCAEHLYDCYIGYDKTKLEFACAAEDIVMVQTHRATDDCVMTLELLKRISDTSRVPDYDKYCAVKAEALGKSSYEVARPLSAYGTHKNTAYIEYAKLFNEGKSIKDIAEIMHVQERTVSERLVEAYQNDMIASVDFMIQPEYEAGIRAIIEGDSWNGRFTPVKNAMPENCTWDCIRAVVAKHKKEQKASGQTKSGGIDAIIGDAIDRFSKQEREDREENTLVKEG